jgi:putative tricarboxylic transport membrane protein
MCGVRFFRDRHGVTTLGHFMIALVLAAGSAAAQEWRPAKNVEIVVASGAGGAADRGARVAQRLLGAVPGFSTITVLNKPGGAGTVAFAYIAQHAGDAHCIGTMATSLLTNEIVGTTKLSYRDLTPLNILMREYVVAWVRVESPIASAKEVVERLRKSPTALSFGFSTAPGNQNHIVIGLLAKAAGVDPKAVKTVVFSSGGVGMTAALGGHVDVWVGTTGGALQHQLSGKARVLGVSSTQRVEGGLAAAPTFREQGIDAAYYAWRGFVGPRGLTAAQTAFWDQAFASVIKTDEWKKDLAANAWAEDFTGAAETRKRLDAEYEQLTERLTELGLAARPLRQ